jgi:hypothetical protein
MKKLPDIALVGLDNGFRKSGRGHSGLTEKVSA